MAPGDITTELLREVPLFSGLVEEELRAVAAVASVDRFEADQVVFREGEASSTCYVIRSGHACALREHPDGRVITLARFGPGDIFGELAMLDTQRRSATVQAVDELEVIAILGPDMQRLLGDHPEIAVKLIVALGGKLRETNERVAGLSFQTVQSRVARVLSQLVHAARTEGAGDHDVLITSTQAELARLAGSSRESASRFLAVLERAGIISQGRGRLTVHDPAALERYVY
ncbi:MAG TPA: Crp/Fnr family transcriptional regulator [Solirubrobacteraceae bacterium]|nr:Crp/Fnr family transcriptional regulator [Solirubrobacteraceae bacterium]